VTTVEELEACLEACVEACGEILGRTYVSHLTALTCRVAVFKVLRPYGSGSTLLGFTELRSSQMHIASMTAVFEKAHEAGG
jgi:hypothetical protein